MNGVRARRQAAADAAGASGTKKDVAANGSGIGNGTGNGNGHAAAAPAETYSRENIFLFWPNVIGMLFSAASCFHLASLSY
jgi:hypothetical protein